MISETGERGCRELPIYVTTAGAHHLQEPRKRPQGARFHHILYIEEGEGVFETPEQKYILSAGSAVFIRREYPINYYAHTEDFRTAWVTFNGSCVEEIMSYFSAKDFSVCRKSNLYGQILSCVSLYRRQSTQQQLSRAVYELVLSYFSEQKESMRPPALIRARTFMEENFERDISVAEIAAAAGISPSLLFRLFQENEKQSPAEMLRTMRINNARHLLLAEPGCSVSEVGKRCGFFDAAYFCKVFKSETGHSPGNYRKCYGV